MKYIIYLVYGLGGILLGAIISTSVIIYSFVSFPIRLLTGKLDMEGFE